MIIYDSYSKNANVLAKISLRMDQPLAALEVYRTGLDNFQGRILFNNLPISEIIEKEQIFFFVCVSFKVSNFMF